MNLLTVPEVAERLRVGQQAVLRKLRAAELRGSKTGKQWLIEEGDLVAYITAGQNIPASDRRRRRRVA